MASLRADQLESSLSRSLAPLYLLHGDDPLLSMEAGDLIRSKARENGFSERQVLTVDRYFNWSELQSAGASMSLFGDRKLVELRIPTGKPGAPGSEAIVEFCSALSPEVLAIVNIPRL